MSCFREAMNERQSSTLKIKNMKMTVTLQRTQPSATNVLCLITNINKTLLFLTIKSTLLINSTSQLCSKILKVSALGN